MPIGTPRRSLSYGPLPADLLTPPLWQCGVVTVLGGRWFLSAHKPCVSLQMGVDLFVLKNQPEKVTRAASSPHSHHKQPTHALPISPGNQPIFSILPIPKRGRAISENGPYHGQPSSSAGPVYGGGCYRLYSPGLLCRTCAVTRLTGGGLLNCNPKPPRKPTSQLAVHSPCRAFCVLGNLEKLRNSN